MTLPPWKPRTAEERRAFADFIISELARQNEEAAREAQSGAGVEYLDHVQGARRLALFGFQLRLPKRRGPKRKPLAEWTNLDFARRDVERMPAIFLKYWGHRNRHDRPTREDIAADFWELSPADKSKLERLFAKGGSGPDNG